MHLFHPWLWKISKYFSFSVFIFLNPNFLFSQNTDSLKRVLDSRDLTTIDRIQTLNELSKACGRKNDDFNAFTYAGEAIALAEKMLQDNISTSDELAVRFQLCTSYNVIGLTYYSVGEYPGALDYHLKSLKLAEEIRDQDKIARSYNNIGLIYHDQGEYAKALSYFSKALKILEEKKDSARIGLTYGNIGMAYAKMKDFPQALEYLNKSMELAKNDSSRLYAVYNNLGVLYNLKDDYQTSIVYYLKSLGNPAALSEEQIAVTYGNIAAIYLHETDYLMAKKYAEISLGKAQKIGHPKLIMDASIILSEIYESMKQPASALYYHKLYSQTKDSLVSSEITKRTLRNELNYEFDKKQAIKKVEEQLILKNQRLVFLAFFILFVGVAYFIYSRQQTRRIKLENELFQLEQKELSRQMKPHFIFNCLNSIGSFISQNNQVVAKQYLAKFGRLMRLILEHSRHQYIPLSEEIELLENYIELEKLRFENKFNSSIVVGDDIDPETDFIPSMLIQPHVENAIIHGLFPREAGGSLCITFQKRKEDIIRCTVEDNGVGREGNSNLPVGKKHKSLGSQIMQERFHLMNMKRKDRLFLVTEDLVDPTGKRAGTRIVFDLALSKENS